MSRIALLTGVLLGAATRLEERTPGVVVGLSSSATWLAAAFALGCVAVRPRWSAAAGAVGLTAANVAYYVVGGWSGPVLAWLVLGVVAGATAGWTGGRCRRAGPAWLAAGAAALAAVAAMEALRVQVAIGGLHLP